MLDVSSSPEDTETAFPAPGGRGIGGNVTKPLILTDIGGHLEQG